jgi:nucleotide-binding universal stress UspA family protein
LVCIDGRDWEAVVRDVVARYLREGEVVLAHVVDERTPRGYGLALRGLLGRRSRRSEEVMALVSEAAAEELLAGAGDLLRQLRPEINVSSVVLKGAPNEELIGAANTVEVQTIFIGRGTPGSQPRVTVSGTVGNWKENPHGDRDGFYLDDGTEVGFRPRTGPARSKASSGKEGRLAPWAPSTEGVSMRTQSPTPVPGPRSKPTNLPAKGRGRCPWGTRLASSSIMPCAT